MLCIQTLTCGLCALGMNRALVPETTVDTDQQHLSVHCQAAPRSLRHEGKTVPHRFRIEQTLLSRALYCTSCMLKRIAVHLHRGNSGWPVAIGHIGKSKAETWEVTAVLLPMRLPCQTLSMISITCVVPSPLQNWQGSPRAALPVPAHMPQAVHAALG